LKGEFKFVEQLASKFQETNDIGKKNPTQNMSKISPLFNLTIKMTEHVNDPLPIPVLRIVNPCIFIVENARPNIQPSQISTETSFRRRS
jgi:hypothetical protein